MNALLQNDYTKGWERIGASAPRPRAILSISAHWFVRQTAVTLATAPRTIHDFGGFPPELYRVQYPAPGDPELARRIRRILAPVEVDLDESWGLDHGTWAVLCHAYPRADIPIVQLSINANQPPAWHYEIGQRLAPLREEGVLIAGSGNLVHNLRRYAWGDPGAGACDWAERFEARTRQMMLAGEGSKLVDYGKLGPDAMLSIPTPEHYLPLLYILGAGQTAEPVSFPVSGIDGGSVSMLAVQLGGDPPDPE